MMKAYSNRAHSGILAYEDGPDWVHLRFAHGGTYEYTRESIGAGNFRTLLRLARAGSGLNTFINTHPRVKDGYTRKLS